jgi:DNA-binding NtrC family response regulator
MSILIADDDANILLALKLLFTSENLESEACQTPAAVLTRIREKSFQLALIDLNYCQDTTSGAEGLELISNLHKCDPELPIIVMTGWATIALAVEAMRRGACDFIEKPWDDNNRLLTTIRNQIKLREMGQRTRRLSAENALLKEQALTRQPLVAQSPAMVKLLESARRVADSDIAVLITGENGTGKSLLANYLHDHSRRRDASLITVNMGGIADATFESELFGHVKGAFTDAKSERIGRVELAEEGTLFLDEIANTPLPQQAKLLRLLEERQFEKLGSSRSQRTNARFIAATNAELDVLVGERGFREDLLYRLNGVTLHVPPLRERKEDIPILAEDFLIKARRNNGNATATAFSPETLQVLQQYNWPGNVRELSHVIERAVLLALDEQIQPEDLQLPKPQLVARSVQASAELRALQDMTLEEAETQLILQALRANGHEVEATAEKLGLSRSALYRRLQKYGIAL